MGSFRWPSACTASSGFATGSLAASRRTGTPPTGRRPATDRAVGRSLTAAALVTIASGGDNLAVYIPLFHEGGVANLLTIVTVSSPVKSP